MRKILAAIGGLVLVVTMFIATALAAITTDQVDWTLSGTNTVDMFTGNTGDGSVTMYSQVNSTRTALDIGPTRGTLPNDTLTELVLYRTQDQGTNFERFSLSAFNTVPFAGYQFTGEAGGTGQLRPLIITMGTNENARFNTDMTSFFGLGSTTSLETPVSQILAPSSVGSYDSHKFRISGFGHDGTVHNADWRQYVDVTATNGTSQFTVDTRKNGSAYSTKLVIEDTGEVGVGTTAPNSLLEVGSGGYLQFSKTSAGAPAGGDCDSNAERGRLSIDTTNNRLYVCNGATRGWDYVALTN